MTERDLLVIIQKIRAEAFYLRATCTETLRKCPTNAGGRIGQAKRELINVHHAITEAIQLADDLIETLEKPPLKAVKK